MRLVKLIFYYMMVHLFEFIILQVLICSKKSLPFKSAKSLKLTLELYVKTL